ncbi:MAG: hypothetical protein U0790_01030 [Isosphaeraceae bacterium]
MIRTASYESTEGAERVNGLLTWLNRIDNFDWIPPSLAFLARYKNQPKLLHRFLADLERLSTCMMVRDTGSTSGSSGTEGARRFRPGRGDPGRGVSMQLTGPRAAAGSSPS